VAEFDEQLLDDYLHEKPYTSEDLRRALRAGTIQGKITPVLCGSAFKNKGVQRLLDAVVDFLPAPIDRPPVTGQDARTFEHITRKVDDAEPFAALAFKIMTDPYVGKLTFFRVYSGTVKSGDSVLNPLTGRNERIGRLVQMHANKRQEIDEVYAGDIAAGIGFKKVTTGTTLCDPKHPVTLEAMHFPDPVVDVAIEPKSKADEEKLATALQRLAEEDPTFRVRTDEETAQTVISGMGELHLEIIVDRMMREFNVQANVGKPQVAYRETISIPAEVRHRFVRQTGGKGMFADVRRGDPLGREGLCSRTRSRVARSPRNTFRRSRRARKSHEERRGRRLPDGGCASDAPTARITSGLVGDGVQDRRLDGLQGGLPEGEAAAARAIMDVEVVVPEVHGRHHRRPPSRRTVGGMFTRRRAVIAASVPLTRCSATRRGCAPFRRGARSIRCSSPGTRPAEAWRGNVAK
jgi:translation elongation factor EF-G